MSVEHSPQLVEKVISVIAGASIVLVLCLTVLGGRTVAVTTDEPAHVDMYNTYLESGWYTTDVPADDFAALKDANSYVLVYGPLVHDVAHRVSVGLGLEEAGTATLNSGSQAVRRGVLALLLAFGAAALSWAGRLATGRWSWGLMGAAFLVSMPVLSGSAMFNVKDLPAAMGLALMVAGLMAAMSPANQRPRGTRLFSVLAITAGWIFTLGSRPALALILLGIIGVAAVVLIALTARGQNLVARSDVGRAVASIAAGSALGYSLLLLLYPKLFSQPLSIVLGSFSSASTFGWGGFTLMAGNQVPSQPGWTYIPIWVSVQTPLFLLLTAGIGVAVTTVAWGFLLRSGALVRNVNPIFMMGATVWSSITIGVPLLLAPTDPYLYNGLRQVLFILPGIAFLALVGTWWLRTELQERDRRVATALVVVAAVLGGVALPILGQLRLFPYSYAGFNSLTSIRGIDGQWETDYWGASTAELSTSALKAREAGLLPESFSYPPDFCNEAGYSGRWKEVSETSEAVVDGEASFYCQVRTWGRNTPPEECEVGWSVERPQLWRQSTMSLIAKCPFGAGPVPEGGINFAVESRDGVLESPAEPFLLWGWQISPDLGIYSNSDSVGLGLRLPSSFRMRDLALELDLKVDLPDETPLGIVIRANGVPVGEVQFSEESKEQNLEFRIPAQVVDRSENDLLVIRIDEMNGTEVPMFLFPQEMKLTAV